MCYEKSLLSYFDVSLMNYSMKLLRLQTKLTFELDFCLNLFELCSNKPFIPLVRDKMLVIV